jgi:hypothetical protein
MTLHTSSSKFRCTLDALSQTIQIPQSVSDNAAEGRISVASSGSSQHVQGANAVWYCGKYIAEMSLDAVDLLGPDGKPQILPSVDLGPTPPCGENGAPACADAVCDSAPKAGCPRDAFLTNNSSLIAALSTSLGDRLAPDGVWAMGVGRGRVIVLVALTDGAAKAFDVRKGKLVELKFVQGDDVVPPYGLAPEDSDHSTFTVQPIDLLRNGTRQIVIRARGISNAMSLSEYHVYAVEDSLLRQVFGTTEQADGCTGVTPTELDQFELCTGAGYDMEGKSTVSFSGSTEHTPKEIRVLDERRVGKVRVTETASWAWDGHRFALNRTSADKVTHSLNEAKLHSEAQRLQLALEKEAKKDVAKDKILEKRKEADRRRKLNSLLDRIPLTADKCAVERLQYNELQHKRITLTKEGHLRELNSLAPQLRLAEGSIGKTGTSLRQMYQELESVGAEPEVLQGARLTISAKCGLTP